MKSFFLILTLLPVIAFSQQAYWQQELSYTIKVELNDDEKTLTGFETIVYRNNSPQALDFIWFHLYANAYKNEETSLFQQLNNDPERKKKLTHHSVGYVDGLNFTSNGNALLTEADPNPAYIDVIKLKLNQPLRPGDSISISTPFRVKLPNYFSRSGYADGEFMACQWYPKPAVFDKDGWHEMPYLDMGEFYSEYASYNVSITLPATYVVGATGNLQNADELQQYKDIGARNLANRNDKPLLYTPTDKKGKKTLQYLADRVPDFAWFADENFVIQYDTIHTISGNTVDAFSYYHNRKKTEWVSSMDYIKDAVKHYGNWIGGYLYPVVQVVEGPKNNSSGGMEYPMITLITSPDAKPETLDAVITHEVGHNWFMSMLGTNEREHAWMDEGLNSYFQFRYEAEKYRSNTIMGSSIPEQVKALPEERFQATIYTAMLELPMQYPIETPSGQFKLSDDYALSEYVKTAIWMYIVEASIGRDKVDKGFKAYFDQWKFKHPQPADFKAAMEKAAGLKLDDLFDLLKKAGRLQ